MKPNAGHNAVAELVARGKVSHVITQNIDNLHQESGVPSDKVIELHGNTRYAKCLSCGARMEIADIRRHFEKHGEPPNCTFCNGIVKTATISFGQAMPEDEMNRATLATHACDLMLVCDGFVAGGLSGCCFPAAVAKRNGARLVIVNRETTEQDQYADLVIHAGIGDTMRATMAWLQELSRAARQTVLRCRWAWGEWDMREESSRCSQAAPTRA